MSICLAFRCQPRANWRDLVEQPKAPSNWKDEKKIGAYLEKKWADLEVAVQFDLLGGRVTHAGILNTDTDMTDVVEAKTFVEYLKSVLPATGRLFGFDIKDRMSQLQLSELQEGRTFPSRHVFRRLGEEPKIVDPAAGTGAPVNVLLDAVGAGVTLEELRLRPMEKGLLDECRAVAQLVKALEYM